MTDVSKLFLIFMNNLPLLRYATQMTILANSREVSLTMIEAEQRHMWFSPKVSW
jgi:hypothetical protein